MITRTKSILIAALVLVPFTALAQHHARPGGPAGPGPAVAPAPGEPMDPAEEDLAWLDEEWAGDEGPGGDRVRRTFVHRGPGGMGMPHHGMAMHMAALDLSDAQRDKLRDLHEAQARKGVQRRADIQLARLDLHKLMRAEKVDVGAVNTQIDRIARLRAEGMKAAFETHLQARALLTPEQLKKFRSGPAHGGGMGRDMRDGE